MSGRNSRLNDNWTEPPGITSVMPCISASTTRNARRLPPCSTKEVGMPGSDVLDIIVELFGICVTTLKPRSNHANARARVLSKRRATTLSEEVNRPSGASYLAGQPPSDLPGKARRGQTRRLNSSTILGADISNRPWVSFRSAPTCSTRINAFRTASSSMSCFTCTIPTTDACSRHHVPGWRTIEQRQITDANGFKFSKLQITR